MNLSRSIKAISGQSSVISDQSSVISDQSSVTSDRWPVIGYRRKPIEPIKPIKPIKHWSDASIIPGKKCCQITNLWCHSSFTISVWMSQVNILSMKSAYYVGLSGCRRDWHMACTPKMGFQVLRPVRRRGATVENDRQEIPPDYAACRSTCRLFWKWRRIENIRRICP